MDSITTCPNSSCGCFTVKRTGSLPLYLIDVDKNEDDSNQVGLIFLLLILITICVFLVYILVVKRKRRQDKRSSGVYKDAWIGSTPLAATLPQHNKIIEIARRPRRDLLKAKTEVTRQQQANEEDRGPCARMSKTFESASSADYASDPVYDNETLTLETSSTESAPCTEQLSDEEKGDTTGVSGETIAKSHEPDRIRFRTSHKNETLKEMNDVAEPEVSHEPEGRESISNCALEIYRLSVINHEGNPS